MIEDAIINCSLFMAYLIGWFLMGYFVGYLIFDFKPFARKTK